MKMIRRTFLGTALADGRAMQAHAKFMSMKTTG